MKSYDNFPLSTELSKKAVELNKKIRNSKNNHSILNTTHYNTHTSIFKNPSIGNMPTKNYRNPSKLSTLLHNHNHKHHSSTIKFCKIIPNKNLSHPKINKIINSIKLLTTASFSNNWLIEIKIIDTNKYSIHIIVLSAYDLFSLGFPPTKSSS